MCVLGPRAEIISPTTPEGAGKWYMAGTVAGAAWTRPETRKGKGSSKVRKNMRSDWEETKVTVA